MSDEKKMKILHVYRSEPNEDTMKLVEILNRDRDVMEFKLYINDPNYDTLVQMIYDADQVISWW